jgi:hypothetical protein
VKSGQKSRVFLGGEWLQEPFQQEADQNFVWSFFPDIMAKGRVYTGHLDAGQA